MCYGRREASTMKHAAFLAKRDYVKLFCLAGTPDPNKPPDWSTQV